MAEPELEEGEACYGKEDTSIDPDIALSYIDEKLQNVLGHFQKDFEGGVSAENLGAKFGGYGSFLPTYQRSPTIQSQPKIPQITQKNNTPKSPSNLQLEGAPHNSLVPSDVQISLKHGSTHLTSLHDSKITSGDGFIKTDSCLPSTQASTKASTKHEPLPTKSVNSTEQKTLRLKIKMGSENIAHKNAAIYSGLGLISPSSSMGHSPEESGGEPVESQETPDVSPASILQCMTSFPVTGSVLLSPLSDSLLQLTRKEDLSGESRSSISVRDLQKDSTVSEVESSMLGNGKVGKKTKLADKTKTLEETKHADDVDFKDNMPSITEKSKKIEDLERKRWFSKDLKIKLQSTPSCNLGDQVKDACRTLGSQREAEKDVPLKKRDVKKDWIRNELILTGQEKEEVIQSRHGQDGGKYEQRDSKSRMVEKIGDHGPRSSKMDISVDPMKGGRSYNNKAPILFKDERNVSESEKDFISGAPVNHLKQKVGPRGSESEQDIIVQRHGKNKLSLDSKNKSKIRESNSKRTSHLADHSFNSDVHISKSKKSVQKDIAKLRASYEDVLDISLGYTANQLSSPDRPLDYKAKEYNLETIGEKHATNGPSSEMELASVAPVIIEEDWVMCDNCHKWRLLPYGTKPDQLPEKWLCSMLNWLPGLNRCEVSEEETETALCALYQPVAESQNNVQSHGGGTAGVMSDDVQNFNHNYHNLNSNVMQNLGKKKNKAKEIANAGSGCGPIPSSRHNNLRQEDVKSRGFNNQNRGLLKRSMISNDTAQRPDNSSNFVIDRYTDHQKEEQDNEVATTAKKMKAKRESDQYGYEITKRIKTEVALHSDEQHNSETGINLRGGGLSSSTDLPTRATGKNFQKDSKLPDGTREPKNRLPVSLKKPRDNTLILPDSGPLEMKTGNEREIHGKKRKLKDWQDSQNDLEIPKSNVNNLLDSKLSQEEEGNSEYKKLKKSKVSTTEGQESSTSRGDAGSKEKVKITRILLSGGGERSGVKFDQQQRKQREKVASLTLDDIDALRKDLGCEPSSAAATSSSSKVSNSRRRSSYQEVKGSSIESVSSSPMKTSNVGKVSLTRKRSSGKECAKIEDSSVMGGPTKSLEQKRDLEGNRVGTARKEESCSGVFQAESVGCPVREYCDHDGSGIAESSVQPPPEYKFGFLKSADDGTLIQQHPCPPDGHASDHYPKEERKLNHNNGTIPNKSGKGLSMLSKDNDKSLFKIQKAKKFSHSLVDQVLSPKNIQSDEMQFNNHQLPHRDKIINTKKGLSDGLSNSNKDSKSAGMKGSKGGAGDSQRQTQMKISELDGSDANLDEPCNTDGRVTLRQNFDVENANGITQIDSRSGRAQAISHNSGKQDTVSLVHQTVCGAIEGNGFDLPPVKGSVDALKVMQQPGVSAHQGTGKHVADQSVGRDLTVLNHVKGNCSSEAGIALKEAERLKVGADKLKKSGFKFESTMAYFQAALKFLLGASLLETSKNEISKHVELAPIQYYTSTAKLCETCAHEFEEHQEMAAAALAYKCMEVAYMRVVYCKSFSCNKDRHDLQASLQVVTQGESPSSSASDVDNLNNHASVDKAALCRSMASNAGNHVIIPRNRPNFVRLLDFMNDVSSAVEASRKSQIAFAAANVILEKVQNNEGVISVKRVIDFSFQDVEELVRLVRLANEAISLQCFSGNRG